MLFVVPSLKVLAINIAELKLNYAFWSLEMPVAECLAWMEFWGIPIREDKSRAPVDHSYPRDENFHPLSCLSSKVELASLSNLLHLKMATLEVSLNPCAAHTRSASVRLVDWKPTPLRFALLDFQHHTRFNFRAFHNFSILKIGDPYCFSDQAFMQESGNATTFGDPRNEDAQLALKSEHRKLNSVVQMIRSISRALKNKKTDGRRDFPHDDRGDMRVQGNSVTNSHAVENPWSFESERSTQHAQGLGKEEATQQSTGIRLGSLCCSCAMKTINQCIRKEAGFPVSVGDILTEACLCL